MDIIKLNKILVESRLAVLSQDLCQAKQRLFSVLEDVSKGQVPIHEISAELAQKVADKRQEQINKLAKKQAVASKYADSKRKQQAKASEEQIKQIRQRIAAIISDKPDVTDLPDKLVKQFENKLKKVVKIPEFSSRGDITATEEFTWGFAALSDDVLYAPCILISSERYKDDWAGWNFEHLGSEYNFPDTLFAWKEALKVIEDAFGDNEDEIKNKAKKARKAEYDKKRREEQKAQKLADSKPFLKFLKELSDEFGSGYIARDDYGYTYIYKDRPRYNPTINGWDEDDNEVYEPGYWEGARLSDKDFEAQLKKAYEGQYQDSAPSGKQGIWKF